MREDKIELVEIAVEKKNGDIEAFDEEKLTTGISRSGIPFIMAKDIARFIHNKLKEKSTRDSIGTIKIREQVVEELKNRNQNTIAESYSGYSKNKITSLKEEHFINSKDDSKVATSMNSQAKQSAKDKDNTSGRGSKVGSP
ncbi:MAG: ATP cone domain-containing protein [Thermoproteota archaeon]|nr:ATP cone domain-containing protein [Thermoproteota archaeon]